MSTQGKRLKNIRNRLNLTQEQLGLALGISKQFYSNIETDRTLLNNEKLVLLFKDYNVNLNYLLGGILPMFNNEKGLVVDDFELRVKNILIREGLIKNKDL